MTAPGVAGSGSVRHFDGSVIVIGAGVAGMSVGYLLGQRNVPCQILEAGPSYGGRVKTDDDFVDFPIPLGGEWLHADAGTLTKIVNDDSVDVSTTLARYRRDATCSVFRNGKLTTESVGRYDDLKFVDVTWLTFYRRYVLPSIAKRMQFDTQIVEIDYSGEKVMLTDATGKRYSADAVVITVPPQIIKDGDVTFVPPLPKRKQTAFADAYIWGGMKVFIEFRKAFYPTFLEIEGTNNRRGQKSFYDAAYGQNSDANVLGLFAVGDQAKPYQALRGNQLRDYLLAELDSIFNGQACDFLRV